MDDGVKERIAGMLVDVEMFARQKGLLPEYQRLISRRADFLAKEIEKPRTIERQKERAEAERRDLEADLALEDHQNEKGE